MAFGNGNTKKRMGGINIKPSHEGMMHADVGKSAGAKITDSDVSSELNSSDPAKRKRGNFARMARRHFKPL